jgi:hypothetical protein
MSTELLSPEIEVELDTQEVKEDKTTKEYRTGNRMSSLL